MVKTMRFDGHLKVENKTETGRHLQFITALIRAVEFLIFLAVIARLSLMFPFYYFRQFAFSIISPPLVFVVGNAIVVALFLRSGGTLSQFNDTPDPNPNPDTTFIVSVYPSNSVKSSSDWSHPAAEIKINCYRRTKSELYVKGTEKVVEERKSGSGAMTLRRSKTEAVKRCVNLALAREERVPEDCMSGAEFRKTIEDFIARQQRLLKEEEEEANFTY